MKKVYLVILVDSANSEVNVGIFTSKSKAIKEFERKFEDYTDDNSNTTWYYNEETNKEVTIEHSGLGWTWYLKEYPLNKVESLF